MDHTRNMWEQKKRTSSGVTPKKHFYTNEKGKSSQRARFRLPFLMAQYWHGKILNRQHERGARLKVKKVGEEIKEDQ